VIILVLLILNVFSICGNVSNNFKIFDCKINHALRFFSDFIELKSYVDIPYLFYLFLEFFY